MNRREARGRAAVDRRNARVQRSMDERRAQIEQLHHVQQILFALVKLNGRVRLPKEAFDGLDGANITMREEAEFWVLDFVPPGFEKPEGAA